MKEQNMNTGKMNGKKIKEVWWPDSRGEEGINIKSNDRRSLELSATYHGDHDEFWIIEKLDGKVIAHHNPKYIKTIVWDDQTPDSNKTDGD